MVGFFYKLCFSTWFLDAFTSSSATSSHSPSEKLFSIFFFFFFLLLDILSLFLTSKKPRWAKFACLQATPPYLPLFCCPDRCSSIIKQYYYISTKLHYLWSQMVEKTQMIKWHPGSSAKGKHSIWTNKPSRQWRARNIVQKPLNNVLPRRL